MKPILALDLGGTTIKAGLVRGDTVLASDAIPARSHEGLAPQLPRLAALLDRLAVSAGLSPRDCAGLGLAVPFLVDPVGRRIRSAPREKYADAATLDLPGWARDRFGLDLRLENDAHAALLAEWQYGAGRGTDDFVMLTLGTGIGCSVLIRGRPLRGKHFQAGVLGGHLIARPGDGVPCRACPARGCYEAESASQSLPAEFADFGTLFARAAAGDATAIAVRDRCVRYWQALFVSVVHAYDPDRIVLGGGVSENPAVRALLPAWEADLNRQAWVVEPVRLRVAALGNHAALIGIASLFTHPPPWL